MIVVYGRGLYVAIIVIWGRRHLLPW
jgi:hypothetical protein